MDPDASWALKLDRAKKHLTDFKAAAEEYSTSHRYAVRKKIEGYGKRERVVHRLDIDQPPTDLMLPLILGDFLFNVRSALDHVVVASVRPRKHRKHAAFPIVTECIFERDASGKYLERHAESRRAWNTMTQGLSDEAQTIVEHAQPYHLPAGDDPFGIGAKNQIFAILSILQNADKHRELVVVGGYVEVRRQFLRFAGGARREVGIPPPPIGLQFHLLENGAEFGLDTLTEPVDPATVEVEVEGPIEVLVGRSTERPPMYRLDTLDAILARATYWIDAIESVMPT